MHQTAAEEVIPNKVRALVVQPQHLALAETKREQRSDMCPKQSWLMGDRTQRERKRDSSLQEGDWVATPADEDEVKEGGGGGRVSQGRKRGRERKVESD